MKWLTSFVGDLFKNVTNTHFELVRVSGGLAMVAYTLGVGAHLFLNKTFDVAMVAGGHAAILAAIGAGTMMKDTARAKVLESANGGTDAPLTG